MRRGLFILLVFLFPVIAYSQQAAPSVVPRLLQIKLKESDVAKVQASRLSVSGDSVVSIGIQRLDVLNQQFGVSKMRRVFPYAGKYEEKYRKYGLHLWYELVLDEGVDPVLAVDFYKSTGAIEDAEPVYKVVRITGLSNSLDIDTSTYTTYQASSSGISRSATVNDPTISKQWHYHNDGSIAGSLAGVDIGLFDAWDVTMGASNIIVAVLDGGVDYAHTDLAANMWKNTAEIPGNGIDDDDNGYIDDIYGYDFYEDTEVITADKHGTHVAGTIAAVSNNGIGVAGVAGGSGSGDGVRIMSCQIFEANGPNGATSADIHRAFLYAANNGAVICQNSWGYDTPGYQSALDLDAIRYFINEAGTDENGNPRSGTPMVGGIVIFAAGNNANKIGYTPTNKYYPQAYDEVVAVSAIGPNGRRAVYANYGDWVDITAPGGHYPAAQNQQIYSTIPGNGYGYDAGTSMACPHVSGVAALILAKYGSSTYTPDMLRNRLLASARSLEELEPTYAPQMGTGLLDALSALNWIHATQITLNQSSLSMLDKHTAQLTANVLPLNASSKSVVWSSSDPNCVSVDNDGNIQAFYDGGRSATITATTADGGLTATCNITVHRERIFISETRLKLLSGQTAQLTAAIVPTNIHGRQILWSSSNPACVTVDTNGKLAALCDGGKSAIITARSDDGELVATCEVLINTKVTAPEGFSPNNDGHNDLFRLVLQENVKYTLKVFDKSGQLHYESADYQNNWNGIANKGPVKGKKVAVGTYYYILTSHEGLAKRGYVIVKY